MTETVTRFRPVGKNELALIEQSDFTAYPPRLPDQPIFYPALNEVYSASNCEGLELASEHRQGRLCHAFYCSKIGRGQICPRNRRGKMHEEIWVPAEELAAFNAAIVGKIDVIAKYADGELVWEK